jgi:hypothetical protein
MVRDLSLLMMAPGRKAGDASIHSGQTLHSVSLLVDDNDRR